MNYRSDQCSSECGTGQQFRTIFCDRSPPNTDRCNIQLTPNTFRECTSNAKCVGEWFIGPWSLCSGDCFNSSRSRTVVCIHNDGFAEESECDLKAKPATFEDCKPGEMKDCKPKWHSSEWTEVNLIKIYFLSLINLAPLLEAPGELIFQFVTHVTVQQKLRLGHPEASH